MSNESPSFLVVEDEAYNRCLLLRHLKKEGYKDVTEAEDGRQAIEFLHARNFDLVLLDIQMPEMDGFDVLQAMRDNMRLRDIPVVMISAADDLKSVVRSIELGAEDYLLKPFNSTLLQARVGASLEKKHLRDKEKSYLCEIKAEKRKSDELLNVILPTAAANELKATGKVIPQRYDDVALLFCDIIDFTAYCDRHDAAEVVFNLQTLFERLEEITEKHGMEKIKTIGDEYMATAGLLRANPNPLSSAVRAGLKMAHAANNLNIGWKVRVGVHMGPVAAGIVGRQKYQFDVWGDTVNTAARMADIGSPGTVAMVYDVWLQVRDEFEARSLGNVPVKGKGDVEVVECYG